MSDFLDKSGLQNYTNQLVAKLKTILALKGEIATDEQVATAVSEWLDENVEPTGATVMLDKTLTIEGAAADAKAAGETIKINETASDATRVLINTTDEDIDLATMEDVRNLENEIKAINPPLENLNWTLGRSIYEDGQEFSNQYTALSNKIPCSPGDILKTDTPTSDHNNKFLVYYICQYQDNTFISRTEFTAFVRSITIGENTNNIRVIFGRYGSSEIPITQEDIDQYVSIELIQKTISESDGQAMRKQLESMTRIQYEFTLKTNVNAYGEIDTNNYMSITQRIPCEAGDLVFRNTQNSDSGGKHLVIYVAEFKGTVFQRRTEMLAKGDTLTIGEDTDNIILCFGRYGSSDIIISQGDITAYFDMGVYRNVLSVPEFNEYIQNDAFHNRGNVIDLGYTSFSQCVLPGLYTFSTANLASITDEPPGLNAGGILIVYNAGTVIWQEIHSTYYEFIRYSANGTWLDKHNYVRVAYSNAAGEDESTESLDIYLPIGVDGRKVRYNIGHCVNASANANVWRITYLYNLLAHQVGGTVMTRRGEFECAVRLANRSDFSGGWLHGDEVDQSVLFSGDGNVIVNPANVNGFYKEFKIVRNSILYDPADHTTAIAEHGVEYVFTSEGLTINQSLRWLISANLSSCYMAMLPILKTFSTYRYDDTSFKVLQNTQSNYSVTIPEATSVTEGNDSIITTMSIGTYPSGLTGGDCALITDNGGATYNKVYFVVCTGGSVPAGTLWKSTTRYQVQ